jgi:hypothetical protein
MAYSSILRRFWWVLVLGAAVSVVAGLAAYRSQAEDPTYTATSQLLVTSAEVPYFRTSVERSSEAPASPSEGGDAVRELIQTVPPDVLTLVRAANLYPLLITSDPVTRLRVERFGDLPGEVSATAIFAVDTPSRFEPSEVPVIELAATAGTPKGAIALAAATSEAFVAWLGQEQDSAGLKKSERITVQELSTPTSAVKSGGPELSLPILVMALVLLGFVALAAMLDRVVPSHRLRRRARPAAGGPGTLEVHPGARDAILDPFEEVAEDENGAGHPARTRRRSFGRQRSEKTASDEQSAAHVDEGAEDQVALRQASGASGGAKAPAKPGRIA